MLNVAIIEDNEMWRYIIQDRLEKSKQFNVIGNYPVGKDFFKDLNAIEDKLDLLLIDLELPGDNGFELADKIKDRLPNVPFIVFSAHVKSSIQAAFYSLGAKAVIPKTLLQELPEELLCALGKGSDEKYDYSQLNRDELRLLCGICEGKTNKELAKIFFKEEGTIEYRCRALANKLRIRNRRQNFLMFAMRYGFHQATVQS